jgi:hypothetical protein
VSRDDELRLLHAEQRRWHTRDGALARGYRRGLRFRIAELLATPGAAPRSHRSPPSRALVTLMALASTAHMPRSR